MDRSLLLTYIGVLLTIIFGVLSIFFQKEMFSLKKWIVLKFFPSKQINDFDEEKEFWLIDSPAPYYKEGNLTASLSNKSLIIEIPEKYRGYLAEKKFTSRSSTLHLWQDKLKETFGHLEISNYNIAIEESCELVFRELKDRLERGHPCFNGPMFGVYDIIENKDEEENNTLNILRNGFFHASSFRNNIST